MKLRKKAIALFTAVLLLATTLPCAFAVSDSSAEPGNSATLTFTFTDVYNVDGSFSISDPQNILSSYTINVTDAGTTAAMVSGDLLWASPSGEPVKTTVKVTVSVTLKSSATPGAYCIVGFNGIYGDANEAPGNEHDVYQSAIVAVKEKFVAPTVTPIPSVPPSAQPTPTSTPTQTVKPTSSPSTTPTVTPSTTPADPIVDYTELQKQITIADGLIKSDYTNESRALLASALTNAKNALNSKDQNTVSAAAKELKDTISGLVTMDYSKLNAVLAQANKLLASEEVVALWQQLSDATQQGSELLNSGDQAIVDAAEAELTSILARIAALLEADSETKVVIQEVPVEVLPDGDYCNITVHHLWLVLFVISAVLNVALIGVIVAYIIKKTKNRKDDTPLVDYDIDDDI